MSWRAQTDTMLSAGRLLSPEIFYNYLERDWSAFCVPVDWGMAEKTFGPSTTFNITVGFPDSWGLDLSLDADAQLRLRVSIEVDRASGAGPGTVGFTTNSVTATGDIAGTGYAWYTLERYWTGTLPTGLTDVECTVTVPASGSMKVRRTHASKHLDSHYRIETETS